jgi:hypothetical protein
MRQTGLQNKPRSKPRWRHTKETGKYVLKEGRRGINWYTYQIKVLRLKLFPFAEECRIDRPDTIVREDGAAPHSSKYTDLEYKRKGIEKIPWLANSLDLNAIKPCWFWIKRKTTIKGPIRLRKS